MSCSKALTQLRSDTSGNVLAIFAAALVPMTMMVGSGLDLATAYMARAKLQNACDAAALAGRQAMEGNNWTTTAQSEANKFFDFNFPDGAHNVTSRTFTIAPDASDSAQIVGSAQIVLPTALMHIFGKNSFNIDVACDAKRDLGHNDVVLVLDVTGSMNGTPSTGGSDPKIQLLRDGTAGLYRALNDDENGSITRYGIVSYSQSVNVGRSLSNNDILKDQLYNKGEWDYREWRYDSSSGWIGPYNKSSRYAPPSGYNGIYYRDRIKFDYKEQKSVDIKYSSWGDDDDSTNENRRSFRESGQACVEERPSVGNAISPVRMNRTITRADVDRRATGSNDRAFQFGRYDPGLQEGNLNAVCPAESSTLQVYGDGGDFQTAVNTATANVSGNTYHDIGMLWGARFISRTGFFASDNPTERGGIPVNQHIVFMTDGIMVTHNQIYSAHGVEEYQDRTNGSGSLNARHLDRFNAACTVAKGMGVTVWVIALDVTAVDDIRPCATSNAHFYASDGSDLEEVFATIGQGIGNLRLTR